MNDIEAIKIKARHPQTNGIRERFHKTIRQEFYPKSSRKRREGLMPCVQVTTRPQGSNSTAWNDDNEMGMLGIHTL